MITDIVSPLKGEQIQFFVVKFSEIEPRKAVTEEIDCLFELGKFTQGITNYSRQIVRLLWRIATEDSGYSDTVASAAVEKFAEIIKNWEMDLKFDYFLAGIDGIRGGKNVLNCLKLLKKMFKELVFKYVPEEKKGSAPQFENVDQCIWYFINEKGLLDAFFHNFEEYCQTVAKKLEE